MDTTKSPQILTTQPVSNNDNNFLYNHAYAYGSENRLLTALNKIIKMLSPYCGPFANYTLINKPDSVKLENVDDFTKDGITIARYTGGDTFVDNIILRIIKTVGLRIDSIANDGTTTAMLFLVIILKNWIIKKAELANTVPDYFHMKNFEKLFSDISEYLEQIKFDTDTFREHLSALNNVQYTDEQILKFVAYKTAMVSSKGDVELSELVSELACTVPVEVFTGSWYTSHDSIEKDCAYELETFDYEWQFTGAFYGTDKFSFLNHKYGTMGLYEDCDVIFSNHLLEQDSDFSNYIKGYMGEYPGCNDNYKKMVSSYRSMFGITKEGPITKPLVVFTPLNSDVQLSNIVNLFIEHSGIPVIIVQLSNLQTGWRGLQTIYINAINSAAGVTPFLMNNKTMEVNDSCVIHGVNVKLFKARCELSNIFKKAKNNKRYHAYFKDTEEEKQEHDLYWKTLDAVNEQLELIKKGNLDNDHGPYGVELLSDLKYAMIGQSRTSLRLSGNIHHIISTESVVKDVMGSVMSVISEGFVFSGYTQIQQYLLSMINKSTNPVYMQVVEESIIDLYKIIYKRTLDLSELPQDSLRTISVVPNMGSYSQGIFAVDIDSSCDIENYQSSDTVLIQSYMGFKAQMIRYKDVLSKLVNTIDFIDGN